MPIDLLTFFLDFLVARLSISSASCAILVFFAAAAANSRSQRPKPVDNVIGLALAASAVPSSLALTLSLFDPEILKVAGIETMTVIGGATVLYVALRQLFKGFKELLH